MIMASNTKDGDQDVHDKDREHHAAQHYEDSSDLSRTGQVPRLSHTED